MNDEHNPRPSSEQTSDTNRADSRAEVEQLRETVRRLEKERDEYKAALSGILRSQVKPEDIVVPDEKECLTLDQFIEELEEIVAKGGAGGAK